MTSEIPLAPLSLGGAPRETEEQAVIANPYDGTPVGRVCLAGSAELEEAIELAAAAFPRMKSLPVHRRAALLERAAELLATRAEPFARLITAECGKPIRQARGEVARAVLTFRLGAGEARSFGGELLPLDLDTRGEGRLCLARRVPLGPIAAIAPFNFPLNLVVHKLCPAIAVGASVVLKPAPQAPLTSLKLAELLAEAGLPEGALSVVPCSPEVAERMVRDDRLRVLSFTGSAAVGWHLKSVAGKKRVLLELGGNAPAILDEGVAVEAVLPALLAGAWGYAGQVCVKVQRLFVHESLAERFLERFVAASRALVLGDPQSETTDVGPLIDAGAVRRVLAWVDEARAAGATLLTGGHADGNLVAPTILTNVPPEQRVACEEVFGPVTVVERFQDFSAALASCNQGRYGLQAGVFTPRLDHALQAGRELEYGGVLINDVPTFRADNMPYGGTKDSGTGREGVRYAMEELTERRVLVLG